MAQKERIKKNADNNPDSLATIYIEIPVCGEAGMC